MVFSYSGCPGLFLSFIANGAQRHLTALARRDEEIDPISAPSSHHR